ncbi:MAG: toxic anion resistance protein [Azoarcus sp.]|jgi:uncharacterized protein YaaN involved in tellurite resistance|nr:toxic anion resistance protein [Azoarcus sp.]
MSETALAPVELDDPVAIEKSRVLAESINLADQSLSVTYGAETMKGIATFADSMLERVRAKDAGPVGETLTNLLVKVKGLDLSAFNQKPRLVERIPLIGSIFNSVQRSIAQFDTLSGQIESVTAKLDESMVGLLKDIEVLEQLYEHNRQFHGELTVYIAAGKARLEKARSEDLPRLKEEAEKSGDNMKAQEVRDFADRINRFERRLHDLQISRTITLQTAPQIRLIQNNNQTLAEKIQTSVLTTIPIWKNQMVIALSLYKQKSAVKLQKEVADTTNELLRQNADMLQTATVDTAREVERSVVDVETLRDVHTKLLATIEETLRIAEEGKTKRVAVEKELQTLDKELHDKLLGMAERKKEMSISHALNAPSSPKAE